jgi:hypothetical protein
MEIGRSVCFCHAFFSQSSGAASPRNFNVGTDVAPNMAGDELWLKAGSHRICGTLTQTNADS